MRQFLYSFLFLGFFDTLWNIYISSDYDKMIHKIQGSSMSFEWMSMIWAYSFMAFGLKALVIPRISANSLINDSILFGGIYGLAVFGTYEIFNFSIFKNWSFSLLIKEIIAGCFVCILSTYMAKRMLLRRGMDVSMMKTDREFTRTNAAKVS